LVVADRHYEKSPWESQALIGNANDTNRRRQRKRRAAYGRPRGAAVQPTTRICPSVGEGTDLDGRGILFRQTGGLSCNALLP